MTEIARLPTLEEINAHYKRLRKLAHGNGVALVDKQHRMAVARLLDNEMAAQRIEEIKQRLV